MSHARAEWASLLSDEPDLRPVTTRWEPTLGCHTKAEVDAPRIACQWRRLASSAEEVMDCWSSPKRAERHKWATARRHVGRIVHLAGTMKHEPECKADPMHWCNNVLRSLSSGNLDIVKRLITIARHVGNEQDKKYRAADAKAWELWLRGEQPKGGTTVHKRAFRFLKGQVGWVRSPLSAQEHLPEVPDEFDAEEAINQELDPAPNHDWKWTPTHVVSGPLGEQQEVDADTCTWSKLWLAGEEATLPSDIYDDLDELPLLGCSDLKKAAMTFPVGTGRGVDNVSPRAFARLSDELLDQLASILAWAERIGGWPAVCRFIMVVLLPKPDGGRRPIGLFHSLVRLWGRARSLLARRWEAADGMGCLYGGAGKGGT